MPRFHELGREKRQSRLIMSKIESDYIKTLS